jgi:dihydroxy-acid dehydratase
MRSDEVKRGPARAAHRALFYAMGYTAEELERPLIAVVNSQNEIVPGHFHLDSIARAAKEGIRSAGGTPIEFPAIGIDDGIAMGHEGMKYPLPSRELIADSIEAMMIGHQFDAMVLITNCDKITPGMLMAAARLNLPAVMVSGGPMLPGTVRGERADVARVFEATGRYIAGTATDEEMAGLEEKGCPGCGSCAGMFTANTMNCLAEVLGLALPGNGTIPAVHAARLRLAKRAGARIMDLLEKDIKPRDLMTRQAFESAIAVDMATGGSTNTVLHLPAIAYEAEIELELQAFDAISQKTPYICSMSPAGKH